MSIQQYVCHDGGAVPPDVAGAQVAAWAAEAKPKSVGTMIAPNRINSFLITKRSTQRITTYSNYTSH